MLMQKYEKIKDSPKISPHSFMIMPLTLRSSIWNRLLQILEQGKGDIRVYILQILEQMTGGIRAENDSKNKPPP